MRGSVSVGPTLRRASRRLGVRENGRIAKAGKLGSAVFIDEDVGLRYEGGVSYVHESVGGRAGAPS